MLAPRKSFLGMVEIANYEDLIDTHGAEPAQYLRDEFFKRIQSWVRPGDQSSIQKNNSYLVVLKGVSTPAELELATAKLTRIFEQPYVLLGQPTAINIHVGFALLEGTSKNIQSEIKKARIALRQAKKSDELYRIFNIDTQNRLDDHYNLIKSLEDAVELGEFQLYYQPKIHAGFGNLVGAEALIRWHTKDNKVLLPYHFIDVAERHEVIRPITWWVIKSAVAQLAKWPSQLGISVNTPPSLLLDDEIFSVVHDALQIFDIKPSRLTLEVTENIMISNPDLVLSQLARLRELGVQISIDDFGTGYSSLAYFRNLPADELKIDKSFVMPMLESKKDEVIVKAVIDLAHNFSLKVVAEGVEDEATAKRLSELGCDHLQGFVFDKPLPIQEFEKRHLT
ncbi:MAG: GGDEF domain-containing phosphodiesterase [Pseudomonadales bacterium]